MDNWDADQTYAETSEDNYSHNWDVIPSDQAYADENNSPSTMEDNWDEIPSDSRNWDAINSDQTYTDDNWEAIPSDQNYAGTTDNNWDTWDDAIPSDQNYAETTFTDLDQHYFSHPLSKSNHETSNKIIMPASALSHLASQLPYLDYPMHFRLENPADTSLHTHCGVLEFTADEGSVFLPAWMMTNMKLQQGDLVRVQNTTLPKGTYIKIQPHATKFTQLSDHKALLERTFTRDFVCVTTGDTIVISDGDDKYMVDVVETRPSPAVLLFETDCEVEFAPPLDYKEPEIEKKTPTTDDEGDAVKKDRKLFPGTGRRLMGGSGDDNCRCLSPVDLSMQKLQVTESYTTVEHEKVERKEEVEFKPFTGVARRIGGEAMPAAVTEKEVAEEMDQAKVEEDVKMTKEGGFKPFTGKSYRLL